MPINLLVTLLGMVNDNSLLQFINALSLMVKFFKKTIDCKRSHLLNALSSIVNSCTLLGIVIDIIFVL